MIWDIRPFDGLGPIHFGMSRHEVIQINIGEITDVMSSFTGAVVEYCSFNIPVCSYRNIYISAIETNRRVKNVFFRDIDIYIGESLEVLRALEIANGGAFEALGAVIFTNIGINAIGFLVVIQKHFGIEPPVSKITEDSACSKRELSINLKSISKK